MELKNKTKQYNSTNFMVYSCQYHVIFCPKYRRSVLINDIAFRLNEIIYDICKEIKCNVIEIEVMPDHVHLLLDVDPKFGIHKTVSIIKGKSSHILREEFPSLKKRLPTLWTRSKFISSVGSVSLEVVKQYILEQKGK